jgi:hypothetical protein
VFNFFAAATFSIEAHFQARAAAGGDFFQQPRHLMQLARTNDQVDVRRPLEDQLLIFLRHTTQHADDFMWRFSLGVFQAPQGTVDFVFGMLADAAGVEQNRVGLGG